MPYFELISSSDCFVTTLVLLTISGTGSSTGPFLQAVHLASVSGARLYSRQTRRTELTVVRYIELTLTIVHVEHIQAVFMYCNAAKVSVH